MGFFYYIGFNKSNHIVSLIGMNLTNGDITFQINLPFTTDIFVGVGQTCNVEPNSGDVFVSGRDENIGGQHHILRVNPKTRTFKSISQTGFIDVLGGTSVYDPKNEILWLQFGFNNGTIDMFGFDVNTGKLVAEFPDNLNMETMSYDPLTGLIYGIGLKLNSTTYERILLTMDSKSNKFNIIATIPNFFIIMGDIGTLNVKDRLYYTLLRDSANKEPFQLLSIRIADGAIQNSVAGCRNGCPLAFEYYNN